MSEGSFLHTCLVPVHSAGGAWLVSGAVRSYPESSASEIAQAALHLATSRPELVFRNPEKLEQGWQRMREDRAALVEFCGGDELVLPPAEGEELLNAYYRHRHETAVTGQPGPSPGQTATRPGPAVSRDGPGDHPRGCGEQGVGLCASYRLPGPSPRVRGAAP
ncbi:hypothetical protein SAMN05421773_102245, partial [Streptomyces aidingensis]